jgi:2-haloacid dehalogenase
MFAGSGLQGASVITGAFCMSDGRVAGRPRAVVFDIGRVLYDWDLRYLFEELIADSAQLDWFLGNVVTEQWHFQSDGGRPLADMLPERIAQFPDQRSLIEAYAARFNETLRAMPETHDIVGRLSAAGMPLYGLTNFGAEFWAGFRPTAPLFDHFANIVVSGQERCAKPDSRIYTLAETRWGLAPSELFFTDDNPANVAAAKARGWQAHLFTGAAALEAQLVTAGLLPQ